MSARAIHAFAVLTLLLGCPDSTPGDDSLPPPFITSLGSHRLFDGKLTIHMLEKGDFVIYKFEESPRPVDNPNVKGTSQVTSSPTKPSIKKGAKWFIFPVSADEVWIYEGEEVITLYTTIDPETFKHHKNGFYIGSSDGNKRPDIVKKAPKEFLDRIPISIKKKYNIDYSDDKPVNALTATGSYQFFKEQMTIDLSEKDNKIHCCIKRKISGEASGLVETGPVRPLFEKEAKWFVYPRSDDEVWVFDGRDHLILMIFGEGHPENVSWHQLGSAKGANGRKVPEKVKERLPMGFLDKPEEK